MIIVLMALLPLRGWAGDGMAIRMANHLGAAKTQSVAAVTTSEKTTNQAAEHANCIEHATIAAAQDNGATPNVSPDHCSTCPTCQACFTVVLLVPSNELPAQVPTPAFQLDRAAAVFASADLAHSQKPPIS